MIEKILNNEHIEYKLIDEDTNVKLCKVKSKYHLLYIENKGNHFMINRDFFEYLDGNSIPYLIVLYDSLNKRFYYLKLKKQNNWLKSCFMTCEKDDIFLGKEILNSRISDIELIKLIKAF